MVLILFFFHFLLIKDELRKESKEAVGIVKKAGVQVVMITGDNKETATSIAKETGIISNSTDLVLTSNDIALMSDAELKKKLPNLKSSSKGSSSR